MNGFFPNVGFNGVNYETVTTLQPIVTRTQNVVNRYYLVTQPYIQENETVYCDHIVKQNVFQNVNTTTNCCDYTEENVYNQNGCGCNNNWF